MMMFGRFGVLNTLSAYDIFSVSMGLSDLNPTVSQGASVFERPKNAVAKSL